MYAKCLNQTALWLLLLHAAWKSECLGEKATQMFNIHIVLLGLFLHESCWKRGPAIAGWRLSVRGYAETLSNTTTIIENHWPWSIIMYHHEPSFTIVNFKILCVFFTQPMTWQQWHRHVAFRTCVKLVLPGNARFVSFPWGWRVFLTRYYQKLTRTSLTGERS